MTKTQVSELYVSIFNRASESTGNKNWIAQNKTAVQTADLMLATDAAKEQFGDSLKSNTAFVEHIYATTLSKGGATVDVEGKKGWVAHLESGKSRGEMVIDLIAALKDYLPAGTKYAKADQAAKDAALQFSNRTAASDYAADTVGTLKATDIAPLMFTTTGLVVNATAASLVAAKAKIDTVAGTFPLNPGTSINIGGTTFEGTTGDDTFVSRADKVDDGTIINGNGGNDTLKLLLDKGETAISPTTNAIDTLEVRVQSTTTVSGDNGVDKTATTASPASYESNIDAQDMKGTTKFWDVDSRADLVIEDVRNNSADTLVGMKQTDVNVDYSLFFNTHNITDKGTKESGAQLTIDLVNVQSLSDKKGALDDNPYNGFEFTFYGKTYKVTPDKFQAAKKYGELAKTINDYIQKDLGLTNVSATTGAETRVFDSVTGLDVGSKTEILITTNSAGKLGTGSWLVDGKLPEDNNMQANMTDKGGEKTGTLTQVNVSLDDVGQGSQGGHLKIGSMSNAVEWTHEGSKGIQEFNVDVNRSSWLQSMTSTLTGTTATNYDTLEVVNLKNVGVNGNVKIDSLTDVRTVNASAMTGEVNITAALTEKSVVKYLHPIEKDTKGETADDITFTYTLGQGKDTLNLTIDNALVADSDFGVSISTGKENDTIKTSIDTMTASQYAAHASLKNLRVDGGEGNDTITTSGEGNWNIKAGSGNDTVYADNSGAGLTTTSPSTSAASTNFISLGAKAEQTMTFAAAAATDPGGIITVANVTVAVGAGWTQNQVTAAVTAAFKDNAKYNVVDTGTGVVTFTWKANAKVDTLLTFVDTGTTKVTVTAQKATTIGIPDGGDVSEVQTIAVTKIGTSGNIKLTVDGTEITVALLSTDTDAQTAQKIADALSANGSVARAFVANDSTVVKGDNLNTTYSTAVPTVIVEFKGTADHKTIVSDTAAVTTAISGNVASANLGDGTVEVQKIAFADTTSTKAGTSFTVDSVKVDLTTTTTLKVDVAKAVAKAFASNTKYSSVEAHATDGSVTFTYAAAGNQDLLKVLDTDSNVNVGTSSTTTSGVAAIGNGVFEVQSITFAGTSTSAANIVVGGVTVAIANADTATQTATKVATALKADATYSDATANNGVVTVTFATLGDKASIANVDSIGIKSTGTTTATGALTTGTGAATSTSANTILTNEKITSDIEGYGTNVSANNAVWTANNLDSDNKMSTQDKVDASSIAGIKGQIQVTFKHLNSKIINLDHSTTTNKSTSYDIRKALKEAINDDAVLSKLLVVKDGPEGTFIVESLIDGVMDLTDLSINFIAPLPAASTAVSGRLQMTLAEESNTKITAFDKDAAHTAYAEAFAQSNGAKDLNGANATLANGSDNTIDAGKDNDVIVLGTSSNSNDTVVFTGSFGKDTIVNFVIGSGTAGDKLDFTDHLTKGTATTYDKSGSLTLTKSEIILNTDKSINKYTTAANTAADGIILVVDTATDANVASVYSATSTTASTAVVTTIIGTIDLAEVSIASLSAADFA